MLKISAVYLIGNPEIPIHYTIWVVVEQALLKFQIYSYFLVASEDAELKTGICKSQTTNPSYSSFFSD
jgi:hypothetical protein